MTKGVKEQMKKEIKHIDYIWQTWEKREEFRIKRKLVDRIYRHRKTEFENVKIMKTEIDFIENNSRDAYKFITNLKQEYKPNTNLCKKTNWINNQCHNRN